MHPSLALFSYVRNPNRLRFVLALACAAGFSGCATTWSESDKAKLSAVSLAPTVVAKDAYQKPDATNSPGMANSLPIATGGGLIPALMGSAIDAAVTAKQQRKFEETHRQHFAALQKTLEVPPAAHLDAALKDALGRHPFLGSRLAEKSPGAFSTEILHYGLQKSPLSQGDNLLLRVRIIAKITLTVPGGGRLFEAQITGVASSAKTASEILADPGFVAKNSAEAAEDFTGELVRRLNAKLIAKK